MDGVAVLKKEEIINRVLKKGYLISATLIPVSLILSVILLCLFHISDNLITLVLCAGLCSSFATLLFPVFFNWCFNEISTGRYQYVVSINPEVSFVELTEKYNVTKNDDGTYVLKEKEN